MTEDEAKQRWCPFARAVVSPEPDKVLRVSGFNRYSADRDPNIVPCGTNCIASACMAWRWKMVDAEGSPGPGIYMVASNTDGWCGLAGGQ